MPLLALRGLTVFPGMILNFDVGRKKSVEALSNAMGEERFIFLVTQKDLRDEDPQPGDLYRTGTVSRVQQIVHLPGENIRVLVEGQYRGRVHEWRQDEPFPAVMVEACAETGGPVRGLRAEALIRRCQELVGEYAGLGPKLPQEVLTTAMTLKEAGALADYVESNVFMRFEDKQEVLEELNALRRIEKVIRLLEREIGILQIEKEFDEKVHSEIEKNQKEYYLREQMKVISEELDGEENPKDEAEEYHDRIDALHLGETGDKKQRESEREAAEKMHEQAERLMRMPFGSHEGTVVRTWLDTCLELPWHKQSHAKIDLGQARKTLDRDHYGLKKVKDRILEYLAVRQLAPDITGQILCLVGPPGVGKTSVARSIAKAAGRKFERLSLGGMRDEADIRGHRKTYIGAMPGRIMNAMQLAGVSNPLILLDEIDKLEGDFRGDPASALLEVLDGEQNSAFRDHFIEIPFDLSHVMFITTANTLDTIPEPLLDRMEIISLSSYTREEKFHIAKEHLYAKQLHRHGLSKRTLRLSDSVFYSLIDFYTREAGVRSLEREIAALCRKAAKQIAEGASAVSYKAEDLEKLLGPKRFRPEDISKEDEVGVVTGLAWTSVGGETMPIEVCVLSGTGKLELTGSLGDVMKESARAAISYIRSRTDELGIDGEFYQNKDIHIHVPEGAIPKDGPSAGVTMATAVVSALLNVPVHRDLAMTGEITLRGRVLPIGGLREKTMAAYRAGVKTVVIPEENSPDLAEIDPVVKDNVRFITASHMDTVLKNALIYPREKPEARGAAGRKDADETVVAALPLESHRPVMRQ